MDTIEGNAAPGARARVSSSSKGLGLDEKAITLPVVLLSLYLLVEYVRPDVLSPARPALLLQVVLLLVMLFNMRRLTEVLKDGYIRLYLLMLAEMAIHVPMATNNYWAFQAFLVMVSYLIFSLGFCIFIDTTARLRVIIFWFMALFSVCSFDIMFAGRTIVGGKGYLGDTNDFAMAMNMAIPIAFYTGLSYKGLKRAVIWSLAAAFAIANVLSFSRGGFVGLLAVAAAIFITSRSKAKTIAALLVISAVFIAAVPQEYKNELLTIKAEGAQSGTGRDRIELWKVSWRAFVHNLVIGVGQGNLPIVMSEYQADENGETYWERGLWRRAVHSIYFTLLPELGIIGASFFAFMLYGLFRKYRSVTVTPPGKTAPRDEDREGEFLANAMKGLFVGMIGFLVSGIFLSAFYYPMFWNLAALITAAYMVSRRKWAVRHG